MHNNWEEQSGLIMSELSKKGVPPAEREDLLQDVLVKLIQGTWGLNTNPAALARTVTQGVAVDWHRQARNRSRLDTEYHSSGIGTDYGTGYQDDDDTGESISTLEPLAKGVSPETMVIEKDLVTKALASLTDEQRQAVYLIDIIGYTYQEAADTVNISKQSFHRRHTRARKGLDRWRASLA